MLGWLILGALLGAAVVTICVSYLDTNVAKNKLREKNIRKAVVKNIIKSDGVIHVNLDALDEHGNEQKVEFETQDLNAYEICRGITITT